MNDLGLLSSEIRVADAIMNPQKAFTLWLVRDGLCRSLADFRYHFGDELPAEELLAALQEDGLLQRTNGRIRLTEVGRNMVKRLPEAIDQSPVVDRVVQTPTVRRSVSSKPLGRQDLIRAVALKSGKSVKESTVFVKAVLDSIREALEAGDSVTLVGFGKFSVKETATSMRVNPETRNKVKIPMRKKVKFTASKELDEAVREMSR